MTPEHDSPEIFTSGTILAGGLRPKTKLRLAAGKTLGARSLASINPLSSIEFNGTTPTSSATSGSEP